MRQGRPHPAPTLDAHPPRVAKIPPTFHRAFPAGARQIPARMKLDHPALVTLLQKACSGEKAAAFAYIGHARSLRDPAAQAAKQR